MCSQKTFTGPDPVMSTPFAYIKTKIMKTGENAYENYWQNSPGCRKAKPGIRNYKS